MVVVALAGLLVLAGAAQAQDRPRAYAVNPSSNLPPGVDSARFAALGSTVARGWRLRVTGQTTRVAGRRDGAHVLGFSPALPSGVLGAYEAWGRRRVVRQCRRGSGCRRVVREQILEADVSVNSTFNWQQGPAYPTADQVDLESVMIHEMGHFADPARPAPPRVCQPPSGGQPGLRRVVARL